MRRKIVMNGPSSLTVTLPSQWTKEHNLNKGDEIDIIETDDGLLIRPVGNTPAIKKTALYLDDIGKEMYTDILLALHNIGYDEIKINCKCEKTTKDINSYLNKMQLGFEIMKPKKHGFIIQNISNPSSEQFHNLYRKIFRIAIEYARKVQDILEDRHNLTMSTFLHEESIRKISNYCRRIIMIDNKRKSPYEYTIIENLCAISSSITKLLEDARNCDNLPEKFSSAYGKIIDYLVEAYNLHYNFSFEKYNNLKVLGKKEGEITQMNISNRDFCLWQNLEDIRTSTTSILIPILAMQF